MLKKSSAGIVSCRDKAQQVTGENPQQVLEIEGRGGEWLEINF